MAEAPELQTAAAEPEAPVETVVEPVVEAPAPAPVVEAAAETPVATPVAEAVAKPARKPRVKAVDKVVAKAVAAPRRGRPAKAAKAASPAPKAPSAPAKAAPAAPAKPVRAKSPRIKAASPAPQAAAAPAAPAQVARRKTVSTRPSPKIGQGKPTLLSLKETFMATPFDLSQLQTTFADFQGKAKAAVEKSTAALGEANDFAKGNVEAVVESGKTLSAGLQDLGATLVADTRAAFEGLTADAKELAAAKSPTEFFQLQSTLLRKQFDGAVAQASKSSEAWLKLANEAFAPLSSRMTIAVEKVSKAA